MKISIIVPVYNSSKYITMCLDSCFGQVSDGELEVVAVNDGSADFSGELLDEYAKQEPRLNVIHTKNQGVTLARRTAIKHSTGDWLFFVDSDDFLPLTALQQLREKANQELADIVIGEVNYLQPDHSLTYCRKNSLKSNDALRSALMFSTTGGLWGRLIKRTLIEQIEWPSAYIKIGEDMICGLQLLAISHKTVLLEQVVYNYIQYPNSTINSRNPLKIASMIPYLEWVDSYFSSNRKDVRDEVDLFILNEYFAYLMYGGKRERFDYFRQIFRRCDKKQLPLKIRFAFSPLGKLFIDFVKKIKKINEGICRR